MSDCLLNVSQKQSPPTYSTIAIERLMELKPTEPVPVRIIKEFQKKFPDKNTTEIEAYLAGFRMGLRPDAYNRGKEYLARRKYETI